MILPLLSDALVEQNACKETASNPCCPNEAIQVHGERESLQEAELSRCLSVRNEALEHCESKSQLACYRPTHTRPHDSQYRRPIAKKRTVRTACSLL